MRQRHFVRASEQELIVLKRDLFEVRRQLRECTMAGRPWPESLCQDAESLLALIRETEPDYER